jgi:hypothetical protein
MIVHQVMHEEPRPPRKINDKIGQRESGEPFSRSGRHGNYGGKNMTDRCTYCGKTSADVGPLTDDHVFPRCTWIGESNDRAIKAKSCAVCNGQADEGLLKSFLGVFDLRLAAERTPHFRQDRGKVDFKRFMAALVKTPQQQWEAYPNEGIAATFKKMFMGLRRHKLKKDWTWLAASCFAIVQAEKVPLEKKDDTAIQEYAARLRPWPLRVGDDGFVSFLPDFETCDGKFRDFAFGIFDYVNAENMAMCLKYERPGELNKLHLLCGVDGTASV